MTKQIFFVGFFLLLSLNLISQELQDRIKPEFTALAVYADVSAPLRDMIPIVPEKTGRPWKDGVVKNIFRTPEPELKSTPDAVAQKRWVPTKHSIPSGRISTASAILTG